MDDHQRMDELEKKIGQLIDAVGQLNIEVAVLKDRVASIMDMIKEARQERASMAAELRGYGIAMTSFVAKFDILTTTVAEMKPVVAQVHKLIDDVKEMKPLVANHDDAMVKAIGASTAGTWIVRVLWLGAAAIATGIMSIATYFGLIKQSGQ